MRSFLLTAVALLAGMTSLSGPRAAAAEPFSLGADFSFTLAGAQAKIASQNEQEGKWAEALSGYNAVISSAALAVKNAENETQARSRDTYMLLGAAHLDAARMEQELLDVSDAEANRQQQRRIADHLSLAQQALTRGLELDDRALAEIREHNKDLPIQQRRFGISYRWRIEQALGQVYALEGDGASARTHYSLAVKANPEATHAQKALDLLNATESGTPVRDLEKNGWNITGRLREVLMSKDARKPISAIVTLCFKSAGPGWSTLAGGTTYLLLSAIQATEGGGK